MAENIKLYDLRDCDFPVGRAFRSLQVFKCHVCGALSNSAWWANCFMGGASNHCPNEKADWHQKLERMQRQLAEPHPKSYKEELQQEINDLLRKADVRNDLAGEPDCGYEARLSMNSGFVVDGVSIRADGTMRIADEIPKVFPPLEEVVFAKFSKDFPPDIASDLRARIPVDHRLRVAMDNLKSDDPDVEKRLEEEGDRLADLSYHKVDPKREERIGMLVIHYGFAYQQWRAEQQLAKVREERSRSSES